MGLEFFPIGSCTSRTKGLERSVSFLKSQSSMIGLQLPAKVAAAVAKAPHHKQPIPFSLIRSLSNFKPAFPPCVCWVVLRVSIGVRVMRNAAEDRLAATVLIRTGQVRDWSKARIPALAAVSPNLDRGAWNLQFQHSELKNHQIAQKAYKAGPKPA